MRFLIVLCLLVACTGNVDETTVELPEGFDCVLDDDRTPFQVTPIEGVVFSADEIDVLETVFDRVVLGNLLRFKPSPERPVLEVDLILKTSADEDIRPDLSLLERLSTDSVVVRPLEDKSRSRRVVITLHGWVGYDSVYVNARVGGWRPGSSGSSRTAIVTREGATWRVCPGRYTLMYN